MTQKPETLCTGCGATVTQSLNGDLRDTTGSRFCLHGAGAVHGHWIVVDLPSTRLATRECSAIKDGFGCTLESPHDGRHEAHGTDHGSEPLFTWENDSVELPPVAIKPEAPQEIKHTLNDKVPAIEDLETKAKSMLLGGYSETDRINFDSVVRLMANFGLSRWADGYSVGITEGMEEVAQ